MIRDGEGLRPTFKGLVQSHAEMKRNWTGELQVYGKVEKAAPNCVLDTLK